MASNTAEISLIPDSRDGRGETRAGFKSYLIYFATSSIIQAISLVSGLLIVNRLSKVEYTYYAIAFSIISAVTAISNSGFTAAVYSVGARVRSDPAELSSLIASILQMRRRISITLNLISVPVLVVLLLRNDASLGTLVLLVVFAILTGATMMESTVLADLLALEYQRKRIQIIGALAQTTRTLGAISLVVAPTQIAAIPIAANLLATWVALKMQRRTAAKLVDLRVSANAEYRREVTKHFYSLLPVNVFVVFQGQIIILFLGIRGESETLANISALTRFSMVFAVISLTINSISGPILARADVKTLRQTYLTILGLSSLATAGMLVVLVYGDKVLLWLLGPQYAGLDQELRVILVGGFLASVADTVRTLNQARGWTDHSWIQIPASLVFIILGPFIFDLNSTMGAAVFTAAVSVPTLLCLLMQLGQGMWRQHSNSS